VSAEERREFERLAAEFREECSPLCNCPCELDGPKHSADSVFRAKHTDSCSILQLIRKGANLGQARGRLLEEENRELRAKLAEKEELIKSLTRAEIAATVERERLRNGS
jgi:hypothetical protein